MDEIKKDEMLLDVMSEAINKAFNGLENDDDSLEWFDIYYNMAFAWVINTNGKYEFEERVRKEINKLRNKCDFKGVKRLEASLENDDYITEGIHLIVSDILH